MAVVLGHWHRALVTALIALMLGACSGSAPRDVEVSIPPGASLRAAADVLEEAGAIGSATRFLARARLTGGTVPIKPGDYRITRGMGDGDVQRLLQSGRTIQRFITIAEGMPSVLVHDRLMAEELLTGKVDVPAEGSVLPETYAFSRGESRATLLARMQAAMDKTVDELWAARSPRAGVRDRYEAITLASIVEKETALDSERRTVAGVYTNRLAIGMKLQADPTIIYPLTRGRPLGRRIRKSEIAAVNGYNTYSMAGLPRGPIANPGRASIAAVLDPEPTPYLFFVADGKGGHIFAETYDQHNRNVQNWFAIRRTRGEMD